MERRRDLRFDIRLACRLQAAGDPQVIDGMTVNLSRSGALIRMSGNNGASPVLHQGDVLLAEVALPIHRQFRPRCLACKGVAVRMLEAGERQLLIAVRFEHVEFRTAAVDAAPVSAGDNVVQLLIGERSEAATSK